MLGISASQHYYTNHTTGSKTHPTNAAITIDVSWLPDTLSFEVNMHSRIFADKFNLKLKKEREEKKKPARRDRGRDILSPQHNLY